jgi:hypothetical protein
MLSGGRDRPSPHVADLQGLTIEPTETGSDFAAVERTQLDDARRLAEALYRGLGGEATAVTAAIRRRDLVIAGELMAAGATPSEAEANAVETSAVSGRFAPVDLRSFERERLGWLAKRRGGHRDSRVFVDRTGQPPSWQIDAPPTIRLSFPQTRGEDLSESRVMPEHAGNQLGSALRSALLTGRS